MELVQQKKLKELRERLAVLDLVIAEFERLESTRRRTRKTYTTVATRRKRSTSSR
jgi:hypothetical protein